MTSVQIVKWVDGDTFDGIADVWWGFGHHILQVIERFRPLGYDAPERGDVGYKEATDFVREILPDGSIVRVEAIGRDFNGRILGRVFISEGGATLDQLMLNAGHGVLRSPHAQALESIPGYKDAAARN